MTTPPDLAARLEAASREYDAAGRGSGAEVAARHGLTRNQIHAYRKKLREREWCGDPAVKTAAEQAMLEMRARTLRLIEALDRHRAIVGGVPWAAL